MRLVYAAIEKLRKDKKTKLSFKLLDVLCPPPPTTTTYVRKSVNDYRL